MCKQYVSVDDYGTCDQVTESRTSAAAKSRIFARRRNGVIKLKAKKVDSTFPMAKMNRLKTYQTLMQVSHMLSKTTNLSLADLIVEPDADGIFPNPWLWKSLSLAPDRGPDMSCMYHFATYKKHMCMPVSWDLCHILKCSTSKVLKAAKLWGHAVLYSAASNCVYGSTLSPPRIQQVRESVQHCMDGCSAGEDEHFMSILPLLVEQMPLQFSLADDDVANKVYKAVRGHKLLYTKGQKVNLGKFQAIIYHSLRTMPEFSLRGYIFSKACMALGSLANRWSME